MQSRGGNDRLIVYTVFLEGMESLTTDAAAIADGAEAHPCPGSVSPGKWMERGEVSDGAAALPFQISIEPIQGSCQSIATSSRHPPAVRNTREVRGF
jgi:hypothetical protein